MTAAGCGLVRFCRPELRAQARELRAQARELRAQARELRVRI